MLFNFAFAFEYNDVKLLNFEFNLHAFTSAGWMLAHISALFSVALLHVLGL